MIRLSSARLFANFAESCLRRSFIAIFAWLAIGGGDVPQAQNCCNRKDHLSEVLAMASDPVLSTLREPVYTVPSAGRMGARPPARTRGEDA